MLVMNINELLLSVDCGDLHLHFHLLEKILLLKFSVTF